MPNPIRTGLIGPALAFVVLLLVAAPVAAQSEPVYLWDQFDTEIVVNEDGSFDVVEQQTIEFQQGTFHFGRREVPRTHFESADSWRVTASDGTDYRQAEEGEEPYTFVVQDYPSRYTLHWYFPEQQDFTDTFTISYRVHGGLRYYDGGDQLHWKAVYPDRGASVLDGAVRVEVPAAIQVYAAYVNGRDARDRASASVGDDGRSVVYTLDRALRDGEDFEVRVEFAPGVVGGSAAEWQHALDEQAAAAEAQELRDARERVLWPVAALVVLAGGLALLFVHWFSAGRDKPAGPIADYLTEPPEGVRPGMVNPLLRETCEMSDIVATAVDLAQRSFLRISQNGSRFTFTKTKGAAGLLPYEEAVMDGLFRWNDKDEVTLEYLRTRFSQVIPTIEARLYWQMVNDGYFQSDIERVRRRYRSRALPGLIFSAFAFFALPLVTGAPASRWLGAALGIVMLALFLLARHMPQKTPKGSDAAARLRAFERYLRNIEQYADMADVQRVWDRWLPYAVAFGIDEQYIDLFAAADAPAPAWYASEPSAPASGMADAPVIVVGPVPAGAPPALASPGAGGPGSALPASGSGTGDGLAQVSRGLGGSLTAMSAGLGAMLAATSRSFAVLPERMPPLNVEGKPGAAGGPRRHGDPGSKGLFTVNKGGSRRRGGRGGGSFSGGGRRGGSGGGGGSGGFG